MVLCTVRVQQVVLGVLKYIAYFMVDSGLVLLGSGLVVDL